MLSSSKEGKRGISSCDPNTPLVLASRQPLEWVLVVRVTHIPLSVLRPTLARRKLAGRMIRKCGGLQEFSGDLQNRAKRRRWREKKGLTSPVTSGGIRRLCSAAAAACVSLGPPGKRACPLGRDQGRAASAHPMPSAEEPSPFMHFIKHRVPSSHSWDWTIHFPKSLFSTKLDLIGYTEPRLCHN